MVYSEKPAPKTQRPKPPSSTGNIKRCNCEYEILTDSIGITEIRTDDNVVNIQVSGCVLFYCTKCLDIQKKVIT